MPSITPTARELSAQIDTDLLLHNLAELVAIPSVNPFEQPPSATCRELEVADFYSGLMQRVGLQTTRDEVAPGRPNVFGRLAGRGQQPCVMLAGHLDTVGISGYADPFTPHIKDGRLYGRGSCDMKAGLAAFIEVARLLKTHAVPLKGDLLLAGLVDEEHGMLGSQAVRAHGPQADFAIVGEPTELNVCHAHKGQICMRIRTFGQACHSSQPERGVNAIVQMAEVIKAFENYDQMLQARPPQPPCGHGRFSPGVIHGGDIASSVPGRCELEVDRRVLAGEDVATVMAEYRDILDPLKNRLQKFDYDLTPTLQSSALNTPVDSPLVQAIAHSYREVRAQDAQFKPFTGGTDAPNLRCDAVICGPGSLSQAHTVDEFVDIEQVVDAVRIYLATVLKLLT